MGIPSEALQEAVDPSAAKVAIAQNMGLLCSVSFNVREALAAGQDRLEVGHGPKSRFAARLVPNKMAATALLRSLLPDSGDLIGAGLQALVFGREPHVEKLQFHTLVKQGEALDEHIAEQEEKYTFLEQELGELVVPTTFQKGTLHFRLPGHHWPTLSIQQPFINEGVDVFSDEVKRQVLDGAPVLKQDLLAFTAIAGDMMEGGAVVDLLGHDNLLVTRDQHLLLVDVGEISPTLMDKVDVGTGTTPVEGIRARLDDLRELAAV